MKIEPVAYWRKWWKMFSVWFSIVGASILGVVEFLPDFAVKAWDMIPESLKAGIPVEYLPKISLALWIVSVFSQFIRQKKLHEEVKKENEQN